MPFDTEIPHELCDGFAHDTILVAVEVFASTG
jgi:hypothetical protein